MQEIVCAAFWRLGPLATNGLTAFFSAVAAVLFYLTCRQIGLRRNHAVLASVALAFTPIIYVNSTVTLDYVWGLAFLMGGLYAACRGRAAWAGVAVGLAIGYRLSSAMMIIPLAILLPRRTFPAFAGLAAIVEALWYVPSFLSYGISFLRFADEPIARIAWVLIIVSPFVSKEGALLKDARLKREQLDSIEHYAAVVDKVKPDIFETGPEIDRFLAQKPSVPMVRSLSPEERIRRLDAGEVIYILRKQGHVYVHGARLSAGGIEVDPPSGIQDRMLFAQLVPRPSAQERLFVELTRTRLFMVGAKSTVEDGRVLREMFGPTLVQIDGRTFLPLITTKERAQVFAADDSGVAPVSGSELPTLFTGIAEIVLDPGAPSQCMVSLTEYQAFLTK